MRILLIAQFGSYGGTREAFKKIINVHASKGFETHIIVDPNSDEKIKKFIASKGFTYTELSERPSFYKNSITSLIYEHKHYRSILKNWKPDLIITSVGTAQFLLYPFLTSYPLVYILHTIPMELSIHIKYFFKIFSFFSGRNQIVCGVSDATVDSVIRNWGYEKDKTAVLHNSFIKEHVNDRVKKSNESEIIILTLGHVVHYKNPGIWLEVAKQITEKYSFVKFIWLGDGALLKEFQKKTEKNSQIEFVGFSNNVKDYYSKASIYFQPSKKENHSFSVLDAMANGLPCVLSDVGGQPETISDQLSGFLCEYDDITSYVEKLSSLIDDAELRVEMGHQAKEQAYKEFHPDEYNEKLIQVYNKVLKT